MNPPTIRRSFPPDMPEPARQQYRQWQAEIAENEKHGMNEHHTRALRDSCHRMIAHYLTPSTHDN